MSVLIRYLFILKPLYKRINDWQRAFILKLQQKKQMILDWRKIL